MSKGKHSNNGGSKFLPGGGKNKENNMKVQNQTNRTMHTNQSHVGGGAHGR